MPLIYKPEPQEMKQVVNSQLEKMTSKQAFSTPRLATIKFKEAAPIIPTQAVPVYHLGLNDLVENRDITAAELRSWRYLIEHNGEVVASADAVINAEGKAVFSHVNEGPLVNGIISALRTANSQKILQSGEYEVRLLMVPALYVAALWFVDATGAQDQAMPIEPTFAPLTTNKLITIEHLIATLQELAHAHSEPMNERT
jgi:hypothetical protein